MSLSMDILATGLVVAINLFGIVAVRSMRDDMRDDRDRMAGWAFLAFFVVVLASMDASFVAAVLEGGE